MREAQNYRNYIEQINQIYPGEMVLNKAQVANLIHKSERTVQRLFPLVDGKTTAPVVARWLCEKYG